MTTKANSGAPVAEGATPSSLGFAMPAEWAKHESTWLSWPKNPLTFPPEIVSKVELAYVEMIEALARGERVDLLVDDEQTEERVRRTLSAKNVSFHIIKSADVWIRDYGPIFVTKDGRGGTVAATKWEFNAWGNKYDDLLSDNATGLEVAASTGLRVFATGVVLEGGSIDVNGRGTLLTTEQCLLNKNRNPHLVKAQIERLLQEYLGAASVVWLERGVAGDDTDGHVDDIARFVDENTVVCMTEQDPRDANHPALRGNQALLSRHKDDQGRRLEVVPIAMPRAVEGDGGRLPASYANFYIGNAAVLVPVFGDLRRDSAALETLSEFFHGRKVVPVDCRELVYGFGGIHCVTQQQPRQQSSGNPSSA
jgi:agmatine deiminase